MWLGRFHKENARGVTNPCYGVTTILIGHRPFGSRQIVAVSQNVLKTTQEREKSLDSRLIGGIGFYAASIGTDVGRRLPVGGSPGGSSVEGDSEGSAA